MSVRSRYLEPPEGFDGLTGDELYEAQAERSCFVQHLAESLKVGVCPILWPFQLIGTI
jgi:hypothetical protein